MSVDEKNTEDTNKEIEFLSRKILDLNKKLIESEKAKSAFLSLVASELNNPMTVLLGLVPRLKPDENSQQLPIFNLVNEQVLQLNFLIENVVAAAEIESGEGTLSHSQTNMAKIVDEIINDFRYKTNEKSLMFIINSDERENIVTDPKKIDLILKNLIANACIYSQNSSTIYITLSKTETDYTIEIQNVGKAAEIEYEAQLFHRFLNGPDGHHGLGLGLSIVRHYTELLNGRLVYKAENDTVTFTVILPLSHDASNSCAIGSDDFMFESFDDAIEL